MVRYDLGGIGMLVRYPVQAMVGVQPRIKEVHQCAFNTKTNQVTKHVLRVQHQHDKGEVDNDDSDITYIDRNRFMAIKVLNTNTKSDRLISMISTFD